MLFCTVLELTFRLCHFDLFSDHVQHSGLVEGISNSHESQCGQILLKIKYLQFVLICQYCKANERDRVNGGLLSQRFAIWGQAKNNHNIVKRL